MRHLGQISSSAACWEIQHVQEGYLWRTHFLRSAYLEKTALEILYVDNMATKSISTVSLDRRLPYGVFVYDIAYDTRIFQNSLNQ